MFKTSIQILKIHLKHTFSNKCLTVRREKKNIRDKLNGFTCANKLHSSLILYNPLKIQLQKIP